MRHEEKASGITREKNKLDQALEEIIDKKLVNEKSSEAKMIEHVIRISFIYMGNSSSTAACASPSNLPWITFLIQSFQSVVRRCCLFQASKLKVPINAHIMTCWKWCNSCRLLKKIHCPKSTGCVYILKHIFPVLSQHRGCVSFSHISHAIIHAKHKLQDIVDERLPLKEFKQNFEAENRLATLELTPTEFQF